MQSICVKTNDTKIINYLLENIKNINLNNVYFSYCSFKIYDNIIIHYKGEKIYEFYNSFSDILVNTIIQFYEKNFLNYLFNINYFYFSSEDKKTILDDCTNALLTDYDLERKQYLYTPLLKYIISSKSLVLEGFVNFRLCEYISFLNNLIDEKVNSFLINKEYLEFISLLKNYVANNDYHFDTVHLIYSKEESILLDSDLNIITNNNILNAKYLSDITFSSNDFTLNTLLSILPKHINLHILSKEDEFVNTIKSVFGNRVQICYDCILCSKYKSSSIKKLNRDLRDGP